MRSIIRPVASLLQYLNLQPRNAVAIGILLTIASFGFTRNFPPGPTAAADSQRMVSLYADGAKRIMATDAATVGDVLERAEIKLGDGDLVEPVASTHIDKGQFNVNVYRARSVLIVDGARSHYIKSAYQSPRLLALAAGLTVYAEDQYKTEVITDFVQNDAIGEKVTITRAKPLIVNVDGATRTIRTQAPTIGQALEGAGISLGLQDTVSTKLDAVVVPGITVSITRVSEVVATITQKLPRPVKTTTDPTMLKGKTMVQNEGADGQKTVTYRIHYQDGKETSRVALQVVSQTEPVAKVVVEGTKVLFAGSVEYWRPQVEAAAAQWGLDPNIMLRIMACESRGNATSVNATPVGPAREHATGLFQYLPSTWRSEGGTDDNIFDGSAQIKITAKKMARQGTGAWSCR